MRYGVLRHSADAPHPTHAPYRQATLDAAFAGPACFNLRYVLGDEGLAIPRRGARPRRHAPNQPPPHPVPPESSYDDLRLPVASGANYVAGLRPVAYGMNRHLVDVFRMMRIERLFTILRTPQELDQLLGS